MVGTFNENNSEDRRGSSERRRMIRYKNNYSVGPTERLDLGQDDDDRLKIIVPLAMQKINSGAGG